MRILLSHFTQLGRYLRRPNHTSCYRKVPFTGFHTTLLARMPRGVVPTDLPIHPFPDKTSFEAFLEQEHATAPGIYVKFAKKASGIPSMTWQEAVEVALCFGWIDGWTVSLDEVYHVRRFTPRRAKSIWSLKNVDTVAHLSDEGKMRPAGLAAVDAAKADGRWDRAYGGPSATTMPEDFQTVLESNSEAKEFWEQLAKGRRYTLLMKVQTSSPKTRAARVQSIVEMLGNGKVFGESKSEAALVKLKEKKGNEGVMKNVDPKTGAVVKSSAKVKVKKVKTDTTTSTPNPPRRAGLRQR